MIKSVYCLAVGLFISAAYSADAFQLRPDTLVFQQNGGSTGDLLVSYDLEGNKLDELEITRGEYAGVAIFGETVYLLDIYTYLYSVNLETGVTTTLLEQGEFRDGLGVYDGNLIGSRFSSSSVSGFTVTGGYTGYGFTPRYGAGGVDGLGSQVLVANFIDGLVDVHDSSGNFVKSIDLGLPHHLTGDLGDVAGAPDGTFWVTLRGGTNEVRNYDLDGQLLRSFSGSGLIHYSAVPEPASMLVLAGVAGVLGLRRRRKS